MRGKKGHVMRREGGGGLIRKGKKNEFCRIFALSAFHASRSWNIPSGKERGRIRVHLPSRGRASSFIIRREDVLEVQGKEFSACTSHRGARYAAAKEERNPARTCRPPQALASSTLGEKGEQVIRHQRCQSYGAGRRKKSIPGKKLRRFSDRVRKRSEKGENSAVSP